MSTFFLALLYWALSGVVITSLHYYVYFRSFGDALKFYAGANTLDEEDKENLKKVEGHEYAWPMAVFISGIIFGPFAIMSLIHDYMRFTIRKEHEKKT